MIWSFLGEHDKQEIIHRVESGEDVGVIAAKYGLKKSSLERKMRLLRQVATPTVTRREFGDVIIETEGVERVMMYADPHFGVHDKAALDAAIAIAEEFNPSIVINLGDTLNADGISSHGSESIASLQAERDAWQDWVEEFQYRVKPRVHHVVIGNHDLRFMRYLADHPEISSLMEFDMNSILGVEEAGLEKVCSRILFNPSGDLLYPDAQLYAEHGSNARKHSGNSVRSEVDKYSGANVAIGHAHRSSCYTRRTDRGVVRGYEVGCLRDLSPSWISIPDWSQSVLIGFVSRDYFDFSLVMIDRGRFVLNGRVREV